MNVWDALMNPDAAHVPAPVKRRQPAERVARQPKEPTNPWGLRDCEVRVLEALCEVGAAKYVAKRLQLAPKTVEQHCWRIRVKMGVENTLLAALTWDRFVRVSQ